MSIGGWLEGATTLRNEERRSSSEKEDGQTQHSIFAQKYKIFETRGC